MIDPPNAFLWLILKNLFDLKANRKIRDNFFKKAGLRSSISALYLCQVFDNRLSFQFFLGNCNNYFVASEELAGDISVMLDDIRYSNRATKRFLSERALDPKLSEAIACVKQLINDPIPELDKQKSLEFLSLLHWLYCVSKYDRQKIKDHLSQYNPSWLPLLDTAWKKLNDHRVPWKFD